MSPSNFLVFDAYNSSEKIELLEGALSILYMFYLCKSISANKKSQKRKFFVAGGHILTFVNEMARTGEFESAGRVGSEIPGTLVGGHTTAAVTSATAGSNARVRHVGNRSDSPSTLSSPVSPTAKHRPAAAAFAAAMC